MPECPTMRKILEDMISAFRGGHLRHALLTTYNFDPGFFERNVLPLLCGLNLEDVRSMGAESLSRELYHPLKALDVTVAYDQSVLQGFPGNFRYTPHPMHLKGGFFHAKIIVLAGEDSQQKPMATVMVGSANLTLSGWGSNIEVAAWTPVNRQNAAELLEFYRYLNHSALAGGEGILKQIRSEDPGPELLLDYPGKEGARLFERLFEAETRRPQDGIHILSPFWAEEPLHRLRSRGPVFCYPAKEGNGHPFPLSSEKVARMRLQILAICGEESFRHAKAYFWNNHLAVGSANCTGQALCSGQSAEAMLLYSEQSPPALLDRTKPLEHGVQPSGPEEGREQIPLGVQAFADYSRRQYRIEVQVDHVDRCTWWKVELDGIEPLSGRGNRTEEIPFADNMPVARVYRLGWQENAEHHSLMGMVIPTNGTDVELGYRPRRSLDQILQDMLRHRVSMGDQGKEGRCRTGEAEESGIEPPDEEQAAEAEDFEFDMYGMYQSFYHLRKELKEAKREAGPEWKFREMADTLQEILLAIRNGDVKHPVQQWLMMQEVVDLAKELSEAPQSGFPQEAGAMAVFRGCLAELDRRLMDALEQDTTLQHDYRISPADFVAWTRQELGYGK